MNDSIEISKIKSSPKDVFMNLLAIVTLYVSVISFIGLWWQYINVLLPDPLNFYYQSAFDVIRLASAALIVVFPVHILLAWLIGKDFAALPEKRELRFRKWLLYFTLFVTAITIIIDLVILVNKFYSGELTTRFVLKVLTVLIVAAAAFGYFIWDLRRKDAGQSKKPKQIAWIVGAVIAASLVAGFFIAGTPSQQRKLRLDERRINDLQFIQSEVINYWVQHRQLPQSLEALQKEPRGFVAPVDPETNAQYEYRILEQLTFELCAEFKVKSVGAGSGGLLAPKAVPVEYSRGGPYPQNWQHEAGRACFKYAIDPKLYPKPEIMPRQ